MKRYVIVGNGVAGTTAAEQIRKNDPDGRIILLTEEHLPFYSRIRLIDYLGGDLDEAGLVVRKPEWYAERRIELQTGIRVTAGDAEQRVGVQERVCVDRAEERVDRYVGPGVKRVALPAVLLVEHDQVRVVERAIGIGLLAFAVVWPSSAWTQDNMQILREKIKADKKLLVARNMDLTESEAQGFWPVYEQYQQVLANFNQPIVKLIESYAAAYRANTMTDEAA